MIVTSIKPDKTPLIHGTTIINHRIRVQLYISVQEYCILDFLTGWYIKETRFPAPSDFFEWMGLSDVKSINAILVELCTKGLYQFGKPTEKWINAFGSAEEFESLWKLHPKGNKKSAKQKFTKIMKRINAKELQQKLDAYITACNASDTFPKNLDTWLNPDKEYYNDPLPVKWNAKPEINSNGFLKQ